MLHQSLKYFNKDSGRPHVLDAIRTICDRFHEGESYTSIFMPPRTGKNSVMLGAAAELRDDSAFRNYVAPWSLLVEQIIDTTTIKKTLEYYADPGLGRRYVTAPISKITSNFYQFERTPDLIGCTISLLLANKGAYVTAIKRAIEETGKRPITYFDEAHLLSIFKTWGGFVETVVEAGTYAVVLTGTDKRRDNKAIAGFTFEPQGDWVPRERRLRTKRIDGDGNIRHYIQHYNINVQKGEETADYALKGGWKTAFDRGWLNRINVTWIDDPVHLRKENGSFDIVSIKDIPKEHIGKMLKDISEGDSLVRKVAFTLIERLRIWRSNKNTEITKALVLTGSDDLSQTDDGRNRHARQIRRFLLEACEKLGVNLRIEIATTTTTSGEPDNTALDKIKAFRGIQSAVNKYGQIDILIVKTMGVVGLDIPELKVMTNLSTIRQGPLAAQGITRASTEWNLANGKASDVILIQDALNIELVKTLEEMGGVVKTTEATLLYEEEIAPPEQEGKNFMIGDDARIVGYSDETGNHYEGDRELLLHLIKSKFFFGNMTDIEILSNYEKGAYGNLEEKLAEEKESINKEEEIVVNMGEKLEKIRGRFGKIAQKYAKTLWSYSADPERYRRELSIMQKRAKTLARVNIPLEDVNDPDILERCIVCLDEVYEKHYRRRNSETSPDLL
jgi:hypothetical protein